MRTVLVTGARGFIGGHVVARAEARGLEVVLPEGDLRDAAVARSAVGSGPNPDAIVHLAAPPRSGVAPWEALRSELEMAGNVLAAAAGRPVLFAGSAAQYGMGGPRPLAEDAPTHPLTPYAGLKCVVERAVTAPPLAGPGRVIWTRTFNIAGPGQSPEAPVASWAEQLARGERVLRTGHLDVMRDFLDVRDVADAFLDLLAGDFGGVVNVGSGRPTSLRSVVEELVNEAGGDARVTVDPALLREQDPPHIVADTARLHAAIAFEPRRALTETLRDVVADFRARVAVRSDA